MRIVILGSACALAFFATGAVAQRAVAGMGGAPSGGVSGGVAEMKPNSVPLSAPEPDPVEWPAKPAECAHRADAQGLRGKIRKHFLRECKRRP